MTSSEREPAKSIDDRAAAWIARIDRGPLDPASSAELDAWLAGDPRRRGAFVRLQAVMHMLDRNSVFGSNAQAEFIEPGREPPSAAPRPQPTRRRVAAGLAAGCGSLLAAAIFGLSRRAGREVETALGEIRRLPLNDGSIAAINTETRLAIDMELHARNIRIERGEVWFQVAKDPARPFTVAAGDVRVRAVGTAFSVQRRDGGADVQVTEGTVEVWSTGNEANRRRITAGARTFATNQGGPAEPIQSADIDRTLSWREGNVQLDGETLGEAAAQFNRYNNVKLDVDAAIRDERVVGRFRTNEPEAFAKAAAVLLGASLTRQQNVLLLRRS